MVLESCVVKCDLSVWNICCGSLCVAVCIVFVFFSLLFLCSCMSRLFIESFCVLVLVCKLDGKEKIS